MSQFPQPGFIEKYVTNSQICLKVKLENAALFLRFISTVHTNLHENGSGAFRKRRLYILAWTEKKFKTEPSKTTTSR